MTGPAFCSKLGLDAVPGQEGLHGSPWVSWGRHVPGHGPAGACAQPGVLPHASSCVPLFVDITSNRM